MITCIRCISPTVDDQLRTLTLTLFEIVQVAIDRMRQPQIVVADMTKIAKKTGKTAGLSSQLSTALTRPNEESSASRKPPMEWQERQLADFSDLRERLRHSRVELQEAEGIPKVKFPAASNGPVWKTFCLQCRSTLFTPILTEKDKVKEEFTSPPDSHVLSGNWRTFYAV